ncbi:putative TOS1-like glycosyl hydrolase-domain-containing protein [Lipomyces kononenkoae]
MHLSPLSLTLALGSASLAAAAAACTQLGGNTYCDPVSALSFDNVGFSGSYDEVTSMDNCNCQKTSASFSGPLAPMNEDISLHFRGPVQILQVAVYSADDQSSSSTGAKIKKRNGHHVHEHQHAVRHAKRDVDVVTEVVTVYETVYYNPDGTTSSVLNTAAPTDGATTVAIADNVVPADSTALASTSTVVNTAAPTYGAPSVAIADNAVPAGSASSASTFVVSVTEGATASSTAVASGSSSTAAASSSSSPASTSSSSSTASTSGSSVSSAPSSSSSASSTASWTRFAYYNSQQGAANGLTFLNNMGGTNGSGTWSSCWGNSLSYANCDGISAASESQTLGDVLLPSDAEVIIFTDTECSTSSCGYYREDIPAYVGFTGDTKLFLLEFSMPTDSSSPEGTGNLDMPAVWFLNGKIPRTQQYGSCSCWDSGCGEFDAFEVLSTGSQYMVPTLHTWQGTNNQYGGGGSSDYFVRPTNGSMKAAIIFDGNNMAINLLELDPSTDFTDSISPDTISQWLATNGTVVQIQS